MSVRGKYCVEFLLLEDGQKFLDDRSFHVRFSQLTSQFPYDFLKFNFTSEVRLFFVEKGKPKIFGIKNVMHVKRNLKNSFFRNTLNRT